MAKAQGLALMGLLQMQQAQKSTDAKHINRTPGGTETKEIQADCRSDLEVLFENTPLRHPQNKVQFNLGSTLAKRRESRDDSEQGEQYG